MRAGKKLRLYSTHNLLGNLSTMTYRCWECDGDPCWCGKKAQPSRDQAVVNWQRFRKRLHRAVGRRPYLSVIEFGSLTGRIHHHCQTHEHIGEDQLAELWGHGRVVPGRYEQPELMTWQQARAAAGYCSTYAGKALDGGYGRQSYFVAEGFHPVPVFALVRTEQEAAEWLAERLGGFDTMSRSEDWGEDYVGPPAFTVRLG